MKYNYCTLFDSGYLSRGLLLYETLTKQSKDAFLYVFAFDEIGLIDKLKNEKGGDLYSQNKNGKKKNNKKYRRFT